MTIKRIGISIFAILIFVILKFGFWDHLTVEQCVKDKVSVRHQIIPLGQNDEDVFVFVQVRCTIINF
jgi:hypothetical protein